jgi:tight adherence protein C
MFQTEYGLIYYAAIGLIGLAVYIVTSMFFSSEEQFKTTEQLEDAKISSKKKDVGIVLKYSRPFFKRYVSPVVSNMKSKKKIKERYKRELAMGGLTDELTPEDFYAFKIFLILGFPILFLVVREFGEFYDWPLSLVPVVSVVGFFYPNIWIKDVIAKRQKDLLLNLPFAVDMLALSVEAGLDFIAAMAKVIEKADPSSLTEEFTLVIKEIRLGSSRAEALRMLSWRTDVMEITSFTSTLIAADSVGASIAPILKQLSEGIRMKRSTMVEKQGAKAATKILYPMLGFFVPSVLIVVETPLVVDFLLNK